MKDLIVLTKLRISLLCGFCASAGYIVYGGKFDINILVPFAGTFLIACGANAFNQIQEKNPDGKMERTKNRPLPEERMSVRGATILALMLNLAGIAVLYARGGVIPAGLGVFSLVWYLGVYYYLKKISAFAAVPGSVVGAIPPAIGWSCAGGSLLDLRLLAIAVFFFLWQVPHFWFLILKYPEDYRENIDTPVLTDYLGAKQLSRITFVWTLATVSYVLILPLFDIIGNLYLYLSLAGTGLITAFRALNVLIEIGNLTESPARAFQGINFLALYTSAVMIVDTMIGRGIYG